MLTVEGINQYYGGSHILRNVGFEAKLGEVTVILGRNGCLLYTSPSPRDGLLSRMPSSA